MLQEETLLPLSYQFRTLLHFCPTQEYNRFKTPVCDFSAVETLHN